MQINEKALEAACAATVLGEDEEGNPVHLERQEAKTAIRTYLEAAPSRIRIEGCVFSGANADGSPFIVSDVDEYGFHHIKAVNLVGVEIRGAGAEAATPSDVAGSEEEKRIDILRIKAFQTNADKDRQAYFDAASKWFQDRHFRRMEAATALRLSAGGGWRTMESAPRDGTRFLALQGSRHFDCWWHDAGYGEAYWQDECDSEPNPDRWQPLPASPTVEAGHVE